MTRPPLSYRLLLASLALPLAGHSVWQAKQTKSRRLAWQRLGLKLPKRSDNPVWIHAASVGEVNAALPLISELKIRQPELAIVLSTITPTGAATAENKLDEDIEHIYLPLDFDRSVLRFIDQLKPRCALIMETEIWPNLFNQIHAANIPLLIVNARLSHRTLNRPPWVRKIYQQAISQVDKILARSTTDRESYLALGAKPEQIQIIGNIKFSQDNSAKTIEPIQLRRPYIVAASTHHDEEMRLAKLWQHNKHKQSHTLVIVPRHPNRGDDIMAQFKTLGLETAQRSRNDEISTTTQLYLADTLGELTQFIAGAQAVIMGGSLINRGGQNILEVARLGKTSICGPHMHNFTDEIALLLKHQGTLQINNDAELDQCISDVLDQPAQLETMGDNAKAALAQQADMAQRYADAVQPYCVTPQP